MCPHSISKSLPHPPRNRHEALCSFSFPGPCFLKKHNNPFYTQMSNPKRKITSKHHPESSQSSDILGSRVQDALNLYTARSPKELLERTARSYAPDATFQDAIMVARPLREVELQFYALQRLFDDVSLKVEESSVKSLPLSSSSTSSAAASPPSSRTTKDRHIIVVHNHQNYKLYVPWPLNVFSSVLPTRLAVSSRITLTVEGEKILHHKDDWMSIPALVLHEIPLPFPYIPLWLREANARMVNVGMRWVLGWEGAMRRKMREE